MKAKFFIVTLNDDLTPMGGMVTSDERMAQSYMQRMTDAGHIVFRRTR